MEDKEIEGATRLIDPHDEMHASTEKRLTMIEVQLLLMRWVAALIVAASVSAAVGLIAGGS